MRSVELFAGGGGLLLGTALAGFHHEVAAEWDQWACDTLRENQAAGHPLAQGIRVVQGDVRSIDWSEVPTGIDLVSGGPPCQPFSAGGKARAADDPRDMFPATVNVIRQLQPRAFIVENVRGLTRPAFANYFSYIRLQLQHPELVARPGESWGDHYARLQAEHTSATQGLRYNLTTTLVNAADYGVPQQRHRVVLVGFRSDVDAEWSFPEPTHSQARLVYDQAISGDYWDRLRVPTRDRVVDGRWAVRAARLEEPPATKPWRTVREALSDLTAPTRGGSRRWLNHVLQEGARSYPGHTGSPIDQPAKALKAGGHGVPGGENMGLWPDGSIRYFSVRESARLQTFPDRWELHGAWGEAMRQLGNAVPVVLAETVARSVAEHLALAGFRKTSAEQRELGTVRSVS
jgi:DNA (cytosine-5)-methyltransferase 1